MPTASVRADARSNANTAAPNGYYRDANGNLVSNSGYQRGMNGSATVPAGYYRDASGNIVPNGDARGSNATCRRRTAITATPTAIWWPTTATSAT